MSTDTFTTTALGTQTFPPRPDFDDLIVGGLDWRDEAQRASLRELRGRVLRPGKPPEASAYAGDDDETTMHLAAWSRADNRLLGIATFLVTAPDEMRLRGMAVEPTTQGAGVGARIIRFAQNHARAHGIRFWCQARQTAIGFYERLGWVGEGALFDVEGVGPHWVMRWEPTTPSQ